MEFTPDQTQRPLAAMIAANMLRASEVCVGDPEADDEETIERGSD